MHDLVVGDLEQARHRTLGLTDLADPTLVTQHDLLMSPLVWNLAHVGQQEELWLLRAGDPTRPRMLPPAADALYDAFKHPAPTARRCRCCRRSRRGPTTTRSPGGSKTRSSTPRPTSCSRRAWSCSTGLRPAWSDTLIILRTGVVASEPDYGDPAWAGVPGHHVVGEADGVVTVTELEA